jgi:phosphate transport system protein
MLARTEERRKPRKLLLHRELEQLKNRMLGLANEVEQNATRAVRALVERDEGLARTVAGTRGNVNQTVIMLEEECLKILALHQPFAIDLRICIAVLKINVDLERINDLAVAIAERALQVTQQPAVELPFDVLGMATKTRAMLMNSLTALVALDAGMARDVGAADDEVDALCRDMFSQVAARIQAHPQAAESLIAVLNSGRDLERIADHATNIAEDVIYIIEGEIVRHGRQPTTPTQLA